MQITYRLSSCHSGLSLVSGSKGRRMDLNASVTRRLARVGFRRVRTDSETFCIVAERPGRRLYGPASALPRIGAAGH